MENFNLNGLTNTQLNELYFKVKKIMVIKRAEFSELDMQLGCLLATIDIEMNRVQCISCDEQNEVINTYINKPVVPVVAPVVEPVEQPPYDVSDPAPLVTVDEPTPEPTTVDETEAVESKE
jgi:hypothetical protein